ncbi:MAG: DUF928 domain-containing protein [Gammaproteobacteria bacterium]|nr:MAG: DUF928 domain-containing protein [Gammaproteobacteria bacterium]
MNCKYFRELITLVVVLTPLLLTPDHAVRAAGKPGQSTPEKTTTPTDKKEQVQKTKRIIYKPPSRGAPAARVGAGTRGVEGAGPELHVLTPDHTGYSSSPQPTLYWYLSKTMSARFEVALINDFDIEPIMETTLDREIKAGINRLDLADYGVSLKPGVVYQWSVALVTDPGQRSSDSIASGRVKYVPLSEAQKTNLDAVSDDEAMWFFANAGYWYDLYDRLSGLITKQPDNKNLVSQRAALLKQVGLQAVTER